MGDFLLGLVEVFSPCVTAEALRANIDWKSAVSLAVSLAQNFSLKKSVNVIQLIFVNKLRYAVSV